jgi:glutathione synthase/RimK-type ligase-like ATP-grasp enzyme
MSNWFLACTPFTSPTAKILASKLGIGYGRRPKRNRNKVIRWGFVDNLERLRNPQYFQNADAIRLCSNKLKSLLKLKEAGVKVPKVYRTLREALDDNSLKFPLYSRKKFHTMGKDIIIINNREELQRAFVDERYMVESIDCKKEYRIHVFKGEIISASKKYFREQLWNELGKPIKKDQIRNNEYGWGYYDIQNMDNVPKDICEQAMKAVEALGLLWGAVDLIRDVRKVNYVLEVNSAPGLREGRADIYVEKFRKLMESY